MLVVALLPDRLRRARLAEGLQGVAVVQFCERLDEFQRLALGPRVGGVVAAALDAFGHDVAPGIRTIREALPHVPVIAYFSAGEDLSQNVTAMVKAGADGTLFANTFDSPVVIRKVLDVSRVACAATVSCDNICSTLPPRLRPAAEYCLRNANRPLSVDEVALVHGVHRKTLFNRFRDACGMAPSTFMSWCRLVAVADAIADGESSFEATALRYEFPSAGSLRGMLSRYLGVRPQQLRSLGGSRFVLGRFARALETASRPGVAQQSRPAQALLAG